MSAIARLFGAACLVSGLVLAAEPVAKITSSDSFQLRGQTVTVAGVPNWNGLAGDEIGAGSSPVMVVFKDGSRAVLAARAKGRIEKNGDDKLGFRLLSGVMTVKLAERSGTAFFSGANAVKAEVGRELTVNAASAQDARTLGRVPPPPPPSTPKPTSSR